MDIEALEELRSAFLKIMQSDGDTQMYAESLSKIFIEHRNVWRDMAYEQTKIEMQMREKEFK